MAPRLASKKDRDRANHQFLRHEILKLIDRMVSKDMSKMGTVPTTTVLQKCYESLESAMAYWIGGELSVATKLIANVAVSLVWLLEANGFEPEVQDED